MYPFNFLFTTYDLRFKKWGASETKKHSMSSPSTINEAYTQANKDGQSLEEKTY